MKNINKIYSVIILSILCLTSCSDDTVFGSGNMVSQLRDVEKFSKLSNTGAIDVNIIHGDTQEVEIIADNNIIGFVKTEVNNDQLNIYLNDMYDYSDIQIRANIVLSELTKLKNTGTGRITVDGIANDEGFEIYNEGSGKITLNGNTKILKMKIKGSGDISSFALNSESCETDITGSGNAEVHCTKNLNVKIEGSGNVYFKGSPEIDFTVNGSGQVIDSN